MLHLNDSVSFSGQLSFAIALKVNFSFSQVVEIDQVGHAAVGTPTATTATTERMPRCRRRRRPRMTAQHAQSGEKPLSFGRRRRSLMQLLEKTREKKMFGEKG